MKYLIKVLAILLIILFSLKLIIHVFDSGHKVSYTVGNFNIEETLKVNVLDSMDNYYFEIKHENFKLNFQVFSEYNKNEHVISDIKYQKLDDYNCILPIFKDEQILTDVMCLKNDGIIYYYHDLNIQNSKMNKFIATLKKQGYDVHNYLDQTSSKKLSNTQMVYEDNLIDNHYLAMENYKGVTLINSEIKSVKLFSNDVYKKPISIFTDKYYVVADYNTSYAFKKVYVVNLINGNIMEIRSYDDISFDSVVQGSVDGNVFLFDKDVQKQYKISLKNETVTANNDSDIKYYNGTWSTMSLQAAIEGKKFDNYFSDKISGYDKVDFVYFNSKKTKMGYYYCYKKDGNKYLVYRADGQNKKLKTYLFTTSDLNSIVYVDDYVYFKNDNTFNYYNNFGVRKVILNSELEFNDDISFGVYVK